MEQLNLLENVVSTNSWSPFLDITEKLNWLKTWGLISKKAIDSKQLYYNGIFSKNKLVPVEVIGYEDSYIAIIDLFGSPHKIHIDYLKEMQPTRKEVEQINESDTRNLLLD